MNIKKLFLISCISLSILSCKKEEELNPALVIPTTYDATYFTDDVVAEYQLRTNFKAFIDEAKKGRASGTIVTAAKLTELFEAGSNNSIKNYLTPAQQTEYLALFTEIEKASQGAAYTLGATPANSVNGGVAGGYLFDENGLELEQIIDKGSFGIIFYNKAIKVLANPTLANLDKALALYGANPTFPNTPTASKTAQPDVLMANYGARRTKTIGATGGLYTEMRDAFLKAQAAIKGGDKYNVDRDAAIATILLKWEEINAATVINYLWDVEAKLTAANVTDISKAAAMHSYGECVGFLKGFKGITKKKISDAQIDSALTKMNHTAAYQLVDDKDKVAALKGIRDDLQAIYGFSDTQIAEFKFNYILQEGR